MAAAYGLVDWLELGLQLPVVLTQGGDDLRSSGIAPVQGTVLGAPLVHAHVSILREARGSPVDLGLFVGAALPLGSGAGLTRDPGSGLAFQPRLGVGRKLGRHLRLGAEVGAVLRERAQLSPFATSVADEVGSLLQLGAGVSTLGEGLRGELAVRALAPLSKTSAAAEVLLGVRYPIPEANLELFAAGGPGFGPMPGVPLVRVLGGLAWTPLPGDRCEEGKPYELDACPALDKDGDGVRNDADRCPEQPGLAQLDGCPDADDDGDGVANLADACPKEPGPAAREGCPVPAPVDGDGDGVPDDQDKCPTQAGPSANGGCPVADGDGDGVPDDQDKCPTEAGSSEHGGCPAPKVAPPPDDGAEGGPVQLETSKTVFFETIYFELNKADISERSFQQLARVAATLKEHPEIRKVRVEGHTDTTGPEVYNRFLSDKRAAAVRDFLVGRGVEASRLEAKGYGPDRPVADNKDFAGRIKNRRTEFVVVE